MVRQIGRVVGPAIARRFISLETVSRILTLAGSDCADQGSTSTGKLMLSGIDPSPRTTVSHV